MAELVLCEPTELYNILNQATKLSRLTEPNYLCLLDVRSKWEYDESHVITAHRVKQKEGKYMVPESVDLECVRYCVVYDSNTSSLGVILEDNDSEDSDRSDQAWDSLTKRVCEVWVRSHKLFPGGSTTGCLSPSLPQELDTFQPYPIEIVPGRIYLGNFSQACNPQIQKDLKIKAHVNVSMDVGPFFVDNSDKLLHIQVEDSLEANLSPFLRHLCHFIDIHLELGSVILVFSKLGISRSCAVIIAYLMHWQGQSLKSSWNYIKKCKGNMCPNRAFVNQLLLWEKIVLGDLITNILDLHY
ncbi:PREDICTED: serine/threonine/tyrosine-interacting-like protein 1 [Chrysochloris asiatica]|uniref:Serine/threonine/tyrosine-interacting-like protein 1 n=1 Tax=Chrysochloris asiatica TaxID=185453 RepID=A0A9B0TE42_CHRAS|nr:PREDICTED: serine/threonine/tyrosine-interacting-like protein 1 [Chrysochloris asiatica]